MPEQKPVEGDQEHTCKGYFTPRPPGWNKPKRDKHTVCRNKKARRTGQASMANGTTLKQHHLV